MKPRDKALNVVAGMAAVWLGLVLFDLWTRMGSTEVSVVQLKNFVHDWAPPAVASILIVLGVSLLLMTLFDKEG